MNNENNFAHVWSIILKFDRMIGRFCFVEDPGTWKERLLRCIWPLILTLIAVLFISTLLMTKFSVIFVFLVAALTVTVYQIIHTNSVMYKNKSALKGRFEWCRKLDELFSQEIYQRIFGNTGLLHLNGFRGFNIKVFKYIQIFMIISGLFGTIGTSVALIFLPESIHPKFSPPLPFFLPFRNQKTWTAFILNTLAQTLLYNEIQLQVLFNVGVFFTLIIHFIGVLDIAKEIVVKFGDDIRRKTLLKNSWVRALDSKPTTSQSSTNNIFEKPDEHLSFNEWIQIITDTITNINEQVSILVNIYTFTMLTTEGTLFSCLQFAGLILMVLKQQQACGIAIGLTCGACAFTICLGCDKLKKKYDDIADEIYNLPWYDLTPKERKLILIMMNCDKIHNGFTAAHIHAFTVERFGRLVRSAYSNCLVLRDLAV